MRPGARMCRAAIGLVARLCCLAALSATAVRAQEPVLVEGVVRDALTEAPLPDARLRIDGVRGGVLAEEDGTFRFAGAPPGTLMILVEQYGYESLWVTLDPTELDGPLVVELTPRPVMLEGVEVVAERLATMKERLTSRRRAVGVQSRAFEQERLMRSAAVDMREFLWFEANLQPVGCSRSRLSSLCVWRRGRPVQPVVYIDEARMIGGLDWLASYRPWELHLVEVYDQGAEIRAYTHQFMERMARRPMALIPIGLGR